MSLLSPNLQAFSKVVECRTVHGAASSLYLTQTAVTQRIRALERSLGTTLFIRTRRGMVPTAEGESLYHYCQAAKGLEGEVMARIEGAAIDSDVELTISACNSMMHSRVISQVMSVMQSYPALSLHFDIRDVDDRHMFLRNGQSDLVIISPQQVAKQMKSHPLAPEKYVLVSSSKWEGRPFEEILSQEKIIQN